MSTNLSDDDVGADTEEDGSSIPLATLNHTSSADSEPPPTYDSLFEAEAESSDHLLDGHGDGAANGPEKAEGGDLPPEEKKKQHDRKIKKLIADLRRECSVEEVAPEEIEMLNVGDDALSESDMSSLPPSAREEKHEPPPEAFAAEEDDITETTEDRADASLRRLSRRLSLVQVTFDAEVDPGSNNNDVEHRRDETSVEDGEDRPEKCGVFARILGSPTRKLIVAFTTVFCLGLLLLLILLPKSFIYVEYHQYALYKNTWTNVVDYSTVYDGGCYLLAPQLAEDALIRFDATAHFIEQSLEIMDDTGLSITIDLTLQYSLKRDEVPQLFRKYHHGYDAVMNSLVESAVKNAAVKFSLDQYRLHRQEVEATILKRVRYVLSGDCCDACCPDKCGRREVDCSLTACRPAGSCHRGYHVTVRYFQLGAITIPETVLDRHIQQIVLQVEAERELFYQMKAIEVKKTEQIAQDIRNRAEELRQEAMATDRAIRMKAEAEKNSIVEKARQDALREVFSHFNISQEEVKLSYIYVHALAEKRDNIRYTYAYNNLGVFSP